MHPEEKENKHEEPRIWLRPSQIKIRFPPVPRDPAMLWIDLLRPSHMRTPGRLAIEIIICLAENGVPHQLFVALLREGLETMVSALTTWEGPDAMYQLWYNVVKYRFVMSSRMSRFPS